MKRQRRPVATDLVSSLKYGWASADEDSDAEDDKYDSKKGGTSQLRGAPSKKKRKTANSDTQASESTAQVGPVLYYPGTLLPSSLDLENQIGRDLHIIILAEHLTLDNDSLRNEDIWGSNPYSVESDPVCILKHSGLFEVGNQNTDFAALRLILRIQAGSGFLEGSESGNIRSKSLTTIPAVCFSALQFHTIKEADNAAAIVQQLKTVGIPGPARIEKAKSPTTTTNTTTTTRGRKARQKKVLEQIDTAIAVDVLPDTLLHFNLSNEICFQYNLNLVCDRGIEPSQWTSHRLHLAVLMIETRDKRYELSWEQQKLTNGEAGGKNGKTFDTYRWAQVNKPVGKTREWHAKVASPLPDELITPIHTGLDWAQLIWGPNMITIKGVAYDAKKLFWIARHDPSDNPAASS